MRVAAIRAAIKEANAEKTALLEQLDAAKAMAVATNSDSCYFPVADGCATIRR